MSEEFKEALKEFLRVVLLAILPVIIDSVSFNGISWRSIVLVGALAGLRFVDKYLHGKELDGVAGGLTRF